jgi:hypothetical protein
LHTRCPISPNQLSVKVPTWLTCCSTASMPSTCCAPFCSGKVEQDIVRELSKPSPLFRPDRFEEAHRLMMRALEVLDRNGARPAQLKKARRGPLRPIAAWVVQLMTRWIVKGYQNRLIDNIRELYERREANSTWGSPEHRMLRRARIDVTRVEQGFRGNPLGLPTFLLGGAVVSTIVSGLSRVVDWLFGDNPTPIIAVGLAFLLVLLGLAWAALYAAGVARRRIRLCCDQPIKALYETVGACGAPPKDESYNFAIYAIVLLALAAIVVPLIGGLLLF